jgi:hypothetical protein
LLLGITLEHTDLLIDALKRAAAEEDATIGRQDAFGQRYIVDFETTGPNGNTATIRSAWIVRGGEPPDLVTCFIL